MSRQRFPDPECSAGGSTRMAKGRPLRFLRGAIGLAAAVIAALAWAPAAAPAAEVVLRVVYSPPLVSIEAREVPLPVLLGEIGRQAGFEVVGREAPRAAISISVRDVMLDEALRQLLRSEDHVIVYRDESGTPRVDSIVLRGPHGAASARGAGRAGVPIGGDVPPRSVEPVIVGAAPPAQTWSQSPPVGVPPVVGAPPAVGVPPAVDAAPAIGPGAPASSAEAAGIAVKQLLETQAVPGLRHAPTPGVTAPPAPPPADTAGALAHMTRAAQQNLKALMDQLEAATEAMRATGAIPPR